jgi:hypothetical protein
LSNKLFAKSFICLAKSSTHLALFSSLAICLSRALLRLTLHSLHNRLQNFSVSLDPCDVIDGMSTNPFNSCRSWMLKQEEKSFSFKESPV